MRFNLANDIPILVIAVLIICLVFAWSRHLQIRPGRKQNALEWLVDFTNNVVDSNLTGEEERKPAKLFGFVVFLFIIVSNEIGLFFQITSNGESYFRSPTASAVVTMTLAMMVLAYSHYVGVKKHGIKRYLKSFVEPFALFLPINLIDDFASFLTLSLRLYGNIYAGEVLIHLISSLAFGVKGMTYITLPFALILMLIWQVFSLFIGAVQTYVFLNLSMVYIDRKANE
ncbi:ATP synthase subunit a [Xylocopilactobacillus apicola]|uniref:ATP synthase subunit a n=1 Tax=Xylocopilactobacillus apicola TaxID=2932184 RepID=A0AAU9D3A6_9LACO|nr:ATP synthase subunit a [Xylocopilactobacillus apicola]